MGYRAAWGLLLATAVPAAAQQPTPLVPAPPGAPSIEASPLGTPPPPTQAEPAPALAPAPSPTARVFCGQSVAYRLADAASVPEPYRFYVGIFSDAAWTPALCAALIVETVRGDGAATITYVFGPMASGGKTQGGVLHGAGIVKDGALLFQNSDGSQYAFKPFYSDLAGSWTTPKGQTYDAVFKKTY
jgi:hypothetical protein